MKRNFAAQNVYLAYTEQFTILPSSGQPVLGVREKKWLLGDMQAPNRDIRQSAQKEP